MRHNRFEYSAATSWSARRPIGYDDPPASASMAAARIRVLAIACAATRKMSFVLSACSLNCSIALRRRGLLDAAVPDHVTSGAAI